MKRMPTFGRSRTMPESRELQSTRRLQPKVSFQDDTREESDIVIQEVIPSMPDDVSSVTGGIEVEQISSQLFRSLKASTQVIDALKKENATLRAEKERFEKKAKESDTILEEVRKGLAEAANVSIRAGEEKEVLHNQLVRLQTEKEAAEEEAKKCDRLLEIAYEGLRMANPKAMKNMELKRERDQMKKEKEAAEEQVRKCEALLHDAYQQLKSKAGNAKEIAKLKAELGAAQARAKKYRLPGTGSNLDKLVDQLKADKDAAEKKAMECEAAYNELEAKYKQDKKTLQKAYGKLLAEKEHAEAKIQQCEELLQEAYQGLKKAKLTHKQKQLLVFQRNRLMDEKKEAEARADKYEVLLKQVFGEMKETVKTHVKNKKKADAEKAEQAKELARQKKLAARPKRPIDDLIFAVLPQEKPFYFF